VSVSKGKRNRRPGGHPAKAAARRERDAARRQGRGPGPESIARRLVREAEELADALDAEVWASTLLGAFWSERKNLSLEELVLSTRDSATPGETILTAIASLGGDGARTALRIVSTVGDGELGQRADELAQKLNGAGSGPVPIWLPDVGQAKVTGAAVIRDEAFDDASTVFLEARHSDGKTHAIGVMIDSNFGMMAKDILPADSIDAIAEVVVRNDREHGWELALERIAPGVAAGRIQAAIELTDMTLDPPVTDEFAPFRAMALLRARGTPGLVAAPEQPEMANEERERLLNEFLSSPEGQGLGPDSAEAHAASLAIDFCADYVDGRPLRWSPVVVELFMADWIPRKVLTDRPLLEGIPSALDAWVRFAGRNAGTPDWAVEETRMAIPLWREEMIERASDPESSGPGKQFLTAAKAAGVDVEDSDALELFMAGWNARSAL
jgi:hypothetical protein